MTFHMSTVRLRRRVAFALGIVCALLAVSGSAADGVDCDIRTASARRLPDAAQCRIPVRPEAVTDPVLGWFARAEDHIAAGRFDDADSALDCADTVLGPDGSLDARYELVRRRGILAYRREHIPEALSHFECALQLSGERRDDVATARDLKNVGTALRRLGDFRSALRSLTLSLEMQRASGEVGGAVLNNIADVYRDLRDPEEAMRFYGEALAAFRAKGESTEAAHVLESMSEMRLDQNAPRQAKAWLEEALRTYRSEGDRAYELRVYGGLVRAALADGAIDEARRWAASALAVADAGGHGGKMVLPASLQLQIARTERLSGQTAMAEARLRDALAGMDEADAERAGLLDELASAQEAGGDRVAAIRSLRQAHARAIALAHAQNDRQLDWLRTRFETAERDRTIAALESENRLRRAEVRQRTLWLALLMSLVAVAALCLGLLRMRRRQRQRLQEAARRALHEQELARYRREADALVEDRGLLQGLLDSREDAVCLVDAEGTVLTANQAAGRLLGIERGRILGQPLTALLAEDSRDAIASALEHMEDASSQPLECVTHADVPLDATLSQWARGDGLIVVELREPTTPVVKQDPGGEPSAEARMREDFRRTLVELMLSLVEVWERGTGTSRIELAEKSRIWRVNIDDGRLRARAMERYLARAKLPRNPRWRDVLRTAYYVLGHCPMSQEERDTLQHRVDAVLTYTRRGALV